MLSVLIAAAAIAGATPEEYASEYGTRTPSTEEATTLERCLAAWGEHPFSELESTRIRVIESSVRVMGFGSVEPRDALETAYPQLVLIHPATSVMTRTTYDLRNPQGWYCLHTTTTVMAQSRINLHCEAHLANSRGATVVIGDDETQTEGGVVVLGEVQVNPVGCTGEE